MEAGRGWGQGALIRGQTSSSAGVGEHNWSAEDLNVYDWGFLRENLKNKKEAEEAAELQNGFFDFLKECKMKQDTKPYFYIEKDEAAYFMRKFTEKRLMDTTFAIKSDRAHQYRNARYNEILVRISDSRIGLGTRSLFFVDEIMGPMKQHVGDNYRLVYGKLPSKTPAKVTSAEKYVEEITKVTHLMMVIVRSLYHLHEKNYLTVNEVNGDLNFIKQTWFRIEEGIFDPEDAVWQRKAHLILKFQSKDRQAGSQAGKYALCHNILRRWMDQNGLQIKDRNKETWETLIEIMNKMIYFGNIKAVNHPQQVTEE
jgi:hypothetical protein